MPRGGARAGAGRKPKTHQCLQILEHEYPKGSPLRDLYEKKLLVRGWAGQKSPSEQEYIRRRRES